MNNDKIYTPSFHHSTDSADIDFLLTHCLPSAHVTDAIKLRTHRKRMALRKRKMLLVRLSIAACVALVAGVWMFVAEYAGPLATLNKGDMQTAMVKHIKVQVPTGQTRSVVLPDGTTVIANSRTTIVYPKTFKTNLREVVIDGEAYIDVTHDAARPFVVLGHGFKLKVLGTKFNVNTYDDAASSVALLEGAVEVTTRNDDAIRLTPNHVVHIKEGAVRELVEANCADYVAWTAGQMNLNGQTVEQIASVLENYYGLSIICADNVAQVQLYGKLQLGSSGHDVLKNIGFLANAKCVVHGNLVNLHK